MEAVYKFYFTDGKGFIPGVPARHLTAEDYEKLSKQQQRSVDASPLYNAHPPRRTRKQLETPQEEQHDG